MKKSRTEYSARNTTVAIAARLTAILAGFFTRVVFTHTLSQEYVGVNGLFSDILNVLALSELGAGTAITYALYHPIADGNIEKQKSLMHMFRQFYRLVAVVVLAGGLSVIPFMDILIKDQPDIEHLTLIFLLYLLNSVLSYLMVYKRTLIDAHQLGYISVIYQTVFLLLQDALQIVILLTTSDFVLFVSAMMVCTVLNNLSVSQKADRLYPYLKEKQVQPLPEGDKRKIYRNIRAMMMHKLGDVAVKNTDNLLLSSLVGLSVNGLYSNYYLIIGSIRQVSNQIFQGITASVGNLGTEGNGNHARKIFEASFFMGQWVFGLAAICIFQSIDLFVGVCFGPDYVFPREVTLILCLNFYLTGLRQAPLVFRESMGIFWYDRYKPLAEAAINLAASVFLALRLGTAGVFLGTMVSTVATSLWVEPYMLYRHGFQSSSKGFFFCYGIYVSVTFLLWLATDLLCRRITGNVWLVCGIRLLICVAAVNLVYLLLYHRTAAFGLLLEKGKMILERRFPGNWFLKQSLSKIGWEAVVEEEGSKPGGRTEEKSDRQKKEKMFCPEELVLLKLLREELTGKKWFCSAAGAGEQEINWESLAEIAQRHGVLSLLYDSLTERPEVPASIKLRAEKAARQTVVQNYRLLFSGRYLIRRLAEAGVSAVLLKGAIAAASYPTPELRKSGDIDLLLLEPEKMDAAKKVLQCCGCREREKQYALHHIVFMTADGVEVELHRMLAEPFDNALMNEDMRKIQIECRGQATNVVCMGLEVQGLSPAYHGYQLLLHMLQHFLRAGFGLKFLCDWTVFWSQEHPEEIRRKYLELVRSSRLKGFSDTVTMVCCQYLGLDFRAVKWMELSCQEDAPGGLMKDILESGEFGKSVSVRMVALRGQGVANYFREFHHQMCLNFPLGSRYCLCWPVLWMITLVRFLRNNRRIRKLSAGKILKKAGQRGRMTKGMGLWK